MSTTPAEREEKQRQISDLAEKILNKAIAEGAAFTEGLCNAAINEAERILGSV